MKKSFEAIVRVLHIVDFLSTDDVPFISVQRISGFFVGFGMILFHEKTGGLWLITEKSFTSRLTNDGLHIKSLNQVEILEDMMLLGRYAHNPKWESVSELAQQIYYKNQEIEKLESGSKVVEILSVLEISANENEGARVVIRLISGHVGVGMFLEHLKTCGTWRVSSLLALDGNKVLFFVDNISDVVIQEGMILYGRYGYEPSRIDDLG